MSAAGVAFAIGPTGFAPILQGMFAGMSHLPLADQNVSMSTIINSPGASTYTLSHVNLTGGEATNVTITALQVQAVPGSNMLAVSLTVACDIHYDHWNESGTQSPPSHDGYATSYPYSWDAGGWGCHISAVAITFELTISVGQIDDFFSTENAWAVTISNAQQVGSSSVSGVAPPSGSVLSTDSWIPFIQSAVNSGLTSVIAKQNFSQGFQDAANSRLATFPDSGVLTPEIRFCFPPVDVAWPATGGMQASVSGRLLYNGIKYDEVPATDLGLPDTPANTVLAAKLGLYEIDAMLWAAAQASGFQKTYNAQTTNDKTSINTAAYQSSVPGLYAFAPDTDITISAVAAGYTVGGTTSAPTLQVVISYIVREGDLLLVRAIFHTAEWPYEYHQAYDLLKPEFGVSYNSAADFDAMLKQQLTSELYNDCGPLITQLANRSCLTCQTGIQVTLATSKTPLVLEALIPLVIQLNNFGVTTTSDGHQAISFNYELVSNDITSIQADPGLTPGPLDAWYTNLFARCVPDYLASLKPPGLTSAAISIPNITGLTLTNVQVSVASDSLLVTADIG
jgi:hypothetical protein